MNLNQFYTRLSVLAIAAFAIFRLAVMGRTGLGDSESYYWAWSQRLDFSYYDHPPVVAWLMRIFTDIGGDTSFMVRMPSMLLFVAMCWLLYKVSMEMFEDARVAFYSILTFGFLPAFGIGALQMVPDVPAAALYLAYFMVLYQLLENNGPPSRWYVLGVLLGIGALSKYFAILLVPSTLLLVAAIPEYRHWYRKPQPYITAIVALLCFSPVLIWNVVNDWPSFRFHLMDRHGGAGFTMRNLEQLLGGQALYFNPFLWLGMLWAVWAGFRRAMEGDRRYAALVAFSGPTLAFFYVVCVWTNESEPHWPAFGYLTALVMMIALGLERWDHWSSRKARRLRAAYAVAMTSAVALFTLFYIHVFTPILPIKPKYDITNELLGWDMVGKKIEEVFGEKIGDRKDGFVLAHHWVLCSQIMFSTGDRLPVACINERRDQFDFWDAEQDLMGKSAVVVTDMRFAEPPSELYHFENVYKITDLPVIRGGKMVRKFTLWVGTGYNGLASTPIQ